MKGKFKGKILNLRNIIVSLIIVVMAAVSGISIVQYNSRMCRQIWAKLTI